MKLRLHGKLHCLIVLMLVVTGVQSQSSVSLRLTNTASIVREDELIILSRKKLENLFGKHINFVNIDKAKTQIPLQYIDEDRDGKWDQLVFLYSFTSNEKVDFKITPTTTPTVLPVEQKAHVRMRMKTGTEAFGPNLSNATMPLKNPATDFSKAKLPMYLTEGPAWENDKVAFRLYFDVRNNKDIYGKITPRMMMDTVGANTKMSYHILSEWGMDVLHVVKSLGAGALALSVRQQGGRDTLIRLGGQNITKTVFQQIADGPLFGKFTLIYDWQINNLPLQIKEDISIWGGQYFYESKVTVVGAPAGSKLITGIADFYENTFQVDKTGKSIVGFSYGKQSENKDQLGLAVLVDQKYFAKADSINKSNTDVNETYIIAQNISNNHPLYYRFYAGWERTDKRFESLEGFKSFIKKEAVKYSEPVKVEYNLVLK